MAVPYQALCASDGQKAGSFSCFFARFPGAAARARKGRAGGGCDVGAGRAQGGRLVVLHTAEAGEAGAMHALLAAGTLPDLRRPSADSYYRIGSFPVLGTCKLDLKALKQKALALSGAGSASGQA